MENNHIEDGSLENSEIFLLSSKVFFNDLILRHLIGFLDHNTLKTFRLVCKTWKQVSDRVFSNRSIVIFDFSDKEDNLSEVEQESQFYVPRNFLQILQDTHSNLPSTSFKFLGIISQDAFESFLDTCGNQVEDLALDDLSITKDNDQLEEYTFDSVRANNITNITIKSISPIVTEWILPLNEFPSIQNISLDGCKVLIKENIKSSPRHVELLNIEFRDIDNNEIERVHLNDFMNFRHLKEITLNGGAKYNMSIDLKDEITVKMVSLRNIELKFLENAKWISRKMILMGIPFLKRNQMKVKDLSIYNSAVNLCALPKIIEKLNLSGNSEIVCNRRLDFPNLKYLEFSGGSEVSCFFSWAECINLSTISLERDIRRVTMELDLNLLPKSVKNIRLYAVDVSGNEIFNCDDLILLRYSLGEVNNVLKKLKPKALLTSIIEYINETKLKSDAKGLEELFEAHVPNIAIGRFEWENDTEFNNSELSKSVDRKSLFYLFEKKMGRAIDQQQFWDWIKF